MIELKVYETNSGLGYCEIAYLIRLNKSENGYNYLCIYTNESDDKFFSKSYDEGKFIADLSEYEVKLTNRKLSDFEFSKGFLFEHFLNTYIFADFEKECEHPYALVYSKCGYEKCNKCGKVLCEG